MEVGVRTLTRFKKGDILDAYMGEIFPCGVPEDLTYSLDQNTKERKRIATITAAQFGNWTRYINHSCKEPSVAFVERTIGKYTLVTIEAIRDINPFEELSVNCRTY